MPDPVCTVGDGLARAMARATELRASSPRRVAVRIVTRHGDLTPGVIVVATVPAKPNSELEAQLGKGVRFVALEELDARAHELPALVDEAAAEVEAAVAGAPQPIPRASVSEAGFDHEAYEAVVEKVSKGMLDAAKPIVDKAVSVSTGGVSEAVALAALKVASLAALGSRIELDELVEMLRSEYKDARSRSGVGSGFATRVH
jgi:hypothetical protein